MPLFSPPRHRIFGHSTSGSFIQSLAAAPFVGMERLPQFLEEMIFEDPISAQTFDSAGTDSIFIIQDPWF